MYADDPPRCVFDGTITSVTQPQPTNTTQIATCEFVNDAIALLPAGLVWSGIAGTSQAAVVNSGYTVDNVSQTTVTLPTVFAKGDVIEVLGDGAGGYIVAAGVGTIIKIGSSVTSSGGTLTSAAAGDTIILKGLVANTSWRVSSTISAGFTPA